MPGFPAGDRSGKRRKDKVDTLIFPASEAAPSAFSMFCIAGRSCVIRFRSPEYRISFPTFMVVILLAGKNGSTLAETQFLATPGSEAIDGMSPLATPIIIPMPVSANARIIAGSAPYNLTLSIDVDSSSFAVASGAGRLSATCP
nr:hypothetical protein Iba_chr01eCG3030 [Ipomoea batatas]